MFVNIINSFGSPDHWHSLQHIRAACAGTELLVELILDIHVNNLGTLFVLVSKCLYVSVDMCRSAQTAHTMAKGCPHIINKL